MARPNTRKSRTTTVRWPIAEITAIEDIAAEYGSNRHALIRLCVFNALQSGAVIELARTAQNAQNVKSPA
jgi:hypothetical protein